MNTRTERVFVGVVPDTGYLAPADWSSTDAVDEDMTVPVPSRYSMPISISALEPLLDVSISTENVSGTNSNGNRMDSDCKRPVDT